MLEYTKYHARFDSATAIEDVLDDVADDVRGTAATLCSLGEASGEVEREQVRIIGESMYFMADAIRDSVSKLFGNIEAKEDGKD